MKAALVVLVSIFFLAGFVFAQGNTATVYQEGTSNTATVDQTGSAHNALVNQYGTNLADVDQYGGNSDIAEVNQGSSGNPVTNVPSAYQWHGAWIEQDGSSNEAYISQTKSGGAASIYQMGNSNIGIQDLNSTWHEVSKTSPRMALDIDQIGDGNYAKQLTRFNFGSYGIQHMWVDQTGDGNYVYQYSNGGMQSVMEVNQNGNNNGNATSADVSATGLSSPLDLPWGTKMPPPNAGGIDPSAISSGTYTQYQNGRYSTAIIDITGSDNKTTQAQEFTVWSVSGQNDATITIIGDFNAVIQAQMGEYNDSYVDIDGSTNVVTTSQEGDDNYADIDLLSTSDGNIAAIQQTGNGHWATITQNGASNTATVVQQP